MCVIMNQTGVLQLMKGVVQFNYDNVFKPTVSLFNKILKCSTKKHATAYNYLLCVCHNHHDYAAKIKLAKNLC